VLALVSACTWSAEPRSWDKGCLESPVRPSPWPRTSNLPRRALVQEAAWRAGVERPLTTLLLAERVCLGDLHSSGSSRCPAGSSHGGSSPKAHDKPSEPLCPSGSLQAGWARDEGSGWGLGAPQVSLPQTCCVNTLQGKAWAKPAATRLCRAPRCPAAGTARLGERPRTETG